MDFEGELIGIVVQVDETVVQEEPVVALLTIRIKDLVTSLNIFHCFNDETLSVISVSPSGLSGSSVVEHISIGNETISLHIVHLNTKDSARHHVTQLSVLLDWELGELRYFLADQVIVLFDVINLLSNLVNEWRSLQPLLIFLIKEHGETGEVLRQYV